MKKQILILVLVFVAGITTAFGQFVPRSIECLTGDALHPIPGNPYQYSITVPGAWDDLHYQWFVTQDQTFIDNFELTTDIELDGGPFMSVTGGSAYNIAYNGAGTADNIEITWNSFVYDEDQPIFVGILVVGENGVCNPNNLKIYRIEPVHAFTLDIANVQGPDILDGYGDNVDNCISDVMGATYNVALDAVNYDFGIDTLFYAVAAANWSGQWQMSVQLAGLQTGQTADIHWGYVYNHADPSVGFDYEVVSGAAADGDWTASNLVEVQGVDPSVGADGEVIFIRLILHHGSQFEGITDTQYTLAVNGQLHDGSDPIPDFFDVHHLCDGGPTGTSVMADFDDIAYQTLLARPEIQNTTPGGDFLPIAP
jgi:hypothetical protein